MSNTAKRALFIAVALGLYVLLGTTPNGPEIQRLLGCFAIGWALNDIQ